MHHFFAFLCRMKHIQRWGLMRNTTPENDLEHAAQAAMVAHALALLGNARFGRCYNAERVMALALYHDCCEVITGDLPTPIKHQNPAIRGEYAKIEALAGEKLLSMLPDDLQSDYRPLVLQADAPERTLVKAADRICAYLKCLDELKAGNQEFRKAADSILDSIRAIPLPEVAVFMSSFVPSFELTLDELG